MAPRTVYANLTDGLQPFSLWDQSLADMGNLGTIPCTASGANAIVLTPIAASFAPAVTIPNQLQGFTFVAAATSTGPITIQIGTASALNLYKEDGVTQAATGDLAIRVLYGIIYNSALNGSAGGYQIVFPITSVINPVITGATISNSTITTSTYNGNTWTAGTGTLTIAAGKTLKADNSIEFAGTDGTVMTFPATSASVLTTAAAVTIAQGGTGQATAGPAFDALSPTTTRGDIISRGASSNARLALGTSGYALLSNGTDPVWSGFLQSGTGAGTRTWNAKAADVVSVLDFTGVDPTGTTDSTAGIAAADTAAAALGKALFFPAGTYKVSSSLTPSASARWMGESWQKSVLSTSSATNDVITVSNGFVSIENLQFTSSVTRTGGNYINISANQVVIRDFYMVNAFQGIFLSAAVSSIWVQRGTITPASASGISIRLHGGVAVSFDHVICTWDGTHSPFAQCYIDNGGDYSFTDCQFIHGASGLEFAPATGQSVSYARFTKCWFDSSTGNGVFFNPSGTGTVTGCDFTQCWFSSSGFFGFNVSGSANNVSNIAIYGGLALNNTSGAVSITGSNSVRILDLMGYNPVGVTAAATMGTSPFTITAGQSPETHYVKQSATNTATVAKGGQQIAALVNASTYYTIQLGPNESYVTTWATTAPTYTKDVH